MSPLSMISIIQLLFFYKNLSDRIQVYPIYDIDYKKFGK